MLSLYTLFESVPKNPDSIILTNTYYPSGLTQDEIYKYYITNKNLILNNIGTREILVFFAIDLNKLIVRRTLKLNKDNYEKIISGRTLSIHNTMNSTENFAIIDIDITHDRDFEKAKQAVFDIVNLFKNKHEIEIYFSGKSSFHLHILLDRFTDPMNNKKYILEILNSSNLKNKYLINSVRQQDAINLDLSSNKYRGGFICPGALSEIGLIATKLKLEDIKDFKKENTKIKIL